MSEATKLFFIVGESTITSPYKYKKFRLPKKVQVPEKKDQVLILLSQTIPHQPPGFGTPVWAGV